jgi:hypothetical protein
VAAQEEVAHLPKALVVDALSDLLNSKDKVHLPTVNQPHLTKAVMPGAMKQDRAEAVVEADSDVVTSKVAAVLVAEAEAVVDAETSITEAKTKVHNKKAADGNKAPSM